MQVKWWSVGRFVVVGISSILLAVSLGYAARTEAAEPARKGVTRTLGIDEGGVLSSSDEATAQAAATGVHRVRGEISWAALEPTQGAYNFVPAESVINRFLNAGLVPIIYFAKNPTWAADSRCGPVDTTDPAKVEAFANALGALAAHFPGVEIWALYNEVDQSIPPDNVGAGCFGSYSQGGVNDNGVPDSKEYAIMLAAAWKAVHTANPSAKLATGAVSFDNFDATSAPPGYPGGGFGGKFNYHFLENVFKYMKKNPLENGNKYFDMLLFNYYDIYGAHWEKQAPGYGIQAKIEVLRSLMRDNQVPVAPLFVTETGEDSLTIGLQAQARCLDMTLVRGAASKLKGMIWWTFRDFPDSANPPANSWKYGLVDQDFNPKLSYLAMQTLASELNGFKAKGNWSHGEGFAGIEAYRFKSATSNKIVVWSATFTPPPEPLLYNPPCSWIRQARLATFNASAVRVVDHLGKAKTIRDNAKKDKDPTVGKIAIKVNSTPKIVELIP